MRIQVFHRAVALGNAFGQLREMRCLPGFGGKVGTLGLAALQVLLLCARWQIWAAQSPPAAALCSGSIDNIARLDRILPARLSYELARRAMLIRSIGAQARDGDLG